MGDESVAQVNNWLGTCKTQVINLPGRVTVQINSECSSRIKHSIKILNLQAKDSGWFVPGSPSYLGGLLEPST